MGHIEDIFRAYDIRGNTEEELTPEVMEQVGRAYGTHVAQECEADAVVLGRDARVTSEQLHDAFLEGLASTAVGEVIDLGLTAFGVALFYAWDAGHECAYITASHLPPEWNGVKFYHPSGVGFMQEENDRVRERFEDDAIEEGVTGVIRDDPTEAYMAHVTGSLDGFRLDVLVDCGNGVGGLTAPRLFRELGADVTTLFEEPDGRFPNRESDISEESCSRLLEDVSGHDIGVAYDGDSDRCALVTPSGRLLTADETAYLVLDEYLEDHDGPVVANVECSRLIEDVAEEHDCEVIRVRVGHTYLYDAVVRNDAVFGVEKAGHFATPEVFPLDDAVAASAFFLDQLAEVDIERAVEELPEYHNAREAYECPDSEKFDVVSRLQERFEDEFERTNTKDGVRVDLDDGWILIRASNTSPKIRLTVEAETAADRDRLRDEFGARLEAEL